MLIKNKTAVITGSNRGIGLKTLEKFSENGADVVACSRKIDKTFLDKVESLKKKFNNKIFPIELDFENEDNVKKAFENINSLNINIDIYL